MSRVPRSSLFYFLLVVVLGIVFYFTWQSIEQGQKSGNWTYSQLLTNAAQPGKVTSVVIKGMSLLQATAVKFGGVAATAFSVNSNAQVTATVPTGAVTGKISITTLGGTAISSAGFTVN